MTDLIDSPFSHLTVPELKEKAKHHGYKGITKLRKTELIHLLETGEVLDVAGRIEGARVFEPDEVKIISDSFSGKYATRDKTIFLLGLCIGSRVTELGQLKVSDVWRNDKPVKTVHIRPETAKRKKARRIPIDVNPLAQNVISEFIEWKRMQGEALEPDASLFVSQKGGHLCRMQIHRILKRTYEEAGIEPERASTHSMRKTAATWLYEMTKDIKCVQDFLGHNDSNTTEQYIDLAFRVVREGVAKFSERLSDVFQAESLLPEATEKNVTKVRDLLHFYSEGSGDNPSIVAETADTVTVLKERFFRLLEIEAQYYAQKEETRRLQEILEEVIHRFRDDPKIVSIEEYVKKRLA